MADTLQQSIDRLKAKAALLTDRYTLVDKARQEAQAQVDELQARVRDLSRQLALRDAEIERLKVSSVLSPDHYDVEATRRFLSELVREIDKCIAQLSI